MAAGDLITSWLQSGDITGFLIAVYTSELGGLFYVTFLMMISIPLYLKYGAIPTAIIWVLFWGGMEIAVPAVALDIGLIMLGLSIGFLLFSVYMGRRGLG